MLALPFVLWVCAAGYQVWVVETEGPFTWAPLPAMQAGYGFCLNVAKATGCPNAPYGYASPSMTCAAPWFWTCAVAFRSDWVWVSWRPEAL